MPFVCGECGRLCRDNFNLKKHALSHIPCTCFYCGQELYGKNSVMKHIQTFHSLLGIRSEHVKRCGLCSFNCASLNEIELHLKQCHQLALEELCINFDSKADFLIWKEGIESETNSLFVKRRGDKGKGALLSTFYCHRSGNARIKPSSSRKRSMKVLGPNRTGGFCPARIQVKFSADGKVFTKGIYQHVGHDFSLARLYLKKSFRKKIAEEFLSKNVPFQETLIQNRKDFPENGVLSREYLLSQKDLHNISRDYHVACNIKHRSNDCTSVRTSSC